MRLFADGVLVGSTVAASDGRWEISARPFPCVSDQLIDATDADAFGELADQVSMPVTGAKPGSARGNASPVRPG